MVAFYYANSRWRRYKVEWQIWCDWLAADDGC